MPKNEECRYMKSHEWAYLDGTEALVGISDHAQKEITDIVFVEAPKLGRKVSSGESVATVESVKAAFDIYSPLSGEISAVNPEVSKDPAIVNKDPHGKGWLFRIKPSSKEELNALMDWKQYQEFLKTQKH